jgi:hypothetical protein
MTREQITTAAPNDEAARLHHARPLIAVGLGAIVAVIYVFVGDSLLLVAGALAANYVHRGLTAKFSQRHTAMRSCFRCVKLASRGPVSRLVVWYFHRRILDNKAAMLILAGGLVVTVCYTVVGKPHAVLPFLVAYELYMVQFALMFRSLVVHRGNEASCRLCAMGDEMHPYGRVQESEVD